ncbi:MAG: hypothetical protein ACREN6_13070 [Gemmatimonadaceae bacterium]
MTSFSDDELRARFEALRVADQQHTPGFRRVLDRSNQPLADDSRAGPRWRLPVTLSLAAAAVTVFAISLTRDTASWRAAAVRPLATWTSPTASLLRTPGSELLESSTLAASVLDGMTLSSAHTLGDKR